MFFTVTNDAHKSNKLLLARSGTRVFILKTPRGIVVVNSYKDEYFYNKKPTPLGTLDSVKYTPEFSCSPRRSAS